MYARWTNGLYYRGVIDSDTADTVHIKFDDGDQITHKRNDLKAVVLDKTPPKDVVVQGTVVIAFWPNRAQYYPGVVAKVDYSRQDSYYILYDDGGKGWARLDQLRIFPNRT